MTLHDITSVEELHSYLATAIQLEHATIPPYLTALYTIRPSTNGDAERVIRAVVVEEMLHLTLAANMLNAVGGRPDLSGPGFVPRYPTRLPDGETDFEVSLQCFSREAIETFMSIERPARAGASDAQLAPRDRHHELLLPAVSRGEGGEHHFYSIGEFYEAIEEGMTALEEERRAEGGTLFGRGLENQITPDYYYSGGGEVIPVVDLDSARAAIHLISEQGEGHSGRLFDDEGEIAHYYRFEQLVLGRYYEPGDEAGHPSGVELDVDWDASYPTLRNASVADYPPGSGLEKAARGFNDYYAGFLQLLTKAFTGRPELLLESVGEMFRIKERALHLVRHPLPGSEGLHAAPTFEMPEPAGV